jgi:transmembrane sensor
MKAPLSIDEIASEWVVRHATTLSPAAKAEFSEWLAKDDRHAEAFARLSRTWTVFDQMEQRGKNPLILQTMARRARRRAQRRLAAVAALVVFGAATFALKPWSRSRPTAVEAGGLTNLVRELPDGSIAELSRGAELDVRFDDQARRITLIKGQAHFRVQKDPKHPFLVRAADVEVAAVGTAFAVDLSAQSVEVVVTEGRVAVDSRKTPSAAAPDARSSTLVDAGNRVIIANVGVAPTAVEVTPMSAADVERRLAWKSSLLEFEGIELTEAVALLNRANAIRITTPDTAVGKLRISGVFRADNPEGFVRIVSSTFDLKVEHPNDRELVLRRL